MQTPAPTLTAACAHAATSELANSQRKIGHCLAQLSETQVWWRPLPSMNSTGNLILHLCGNIRQWIVAGVGGAPDVRNRPLEFSERGPIAKETLLLQLAETVSEASSMIGRATDPQLLALRRIQGFEVTGIGAIFHAVAHFQGHTQEIVHLTRRQLGENYQFDFVPRTPEQGAS